MLLSKIHSGTEIIQIRGSRSNGLQFVVLGAFSSLENEMSYCVECGKELGDEKYCSSCGRANGEFVPTPAQSAGQPTYSKFCNGCGRGLVSTAVMCPSCGTSVGSAGGAAGIKDKTVAILLAVFLGHWTWLYTYERDSQKFWIATGLWVLGLLLLFVFFGILPLLGIYIWAIVDVAQKPNSYYVNFPQG